MAPSFVPPENALGAELVWWREGGGTHTVVTIAGGLFAEAIGAERVALTFALHESDGTFVRAWEREMRADEVVVVDSRETTARATEGALVIWVSAREPEEPAGRKHYARAMTMVDWLGEGQIVSLHADQSVVKESRALELTEMVFLETEETKTYLVIVNGPEEQAPGALSLVLRNARGEERAVSYAGAMAPFSVTKVRLAELTRDLIGFCDGVEATISGRFEARGVFTRPYVMTEGAIASGYHGGDRYAMKAIPRMVHRALSFAEASDAMPWEVMLVAGQKEMNPAYAVHREDLTTRIHLFQSHGALEEDFFVDATLYDTAGKLVAHRERWAIAPRKGATTCAVADLVPSGFEGHIALRFSDDPTKEAFPHRLQALLEYRAPVSVARSMLWSDRWNAPHRVRRQSRPWRAMFRVFSRMRRLSTLAITNPSVAPDYDRTAPYVIRLRSVRGEELVHRGELGPNATFVATIDELFPDRWDDEVALAIVESAFDLASMHLTRDARSGVISAEHLLAVPERDGDALVMPCGG